MTPERRTIPRTTIEKLAYINIEPNNGGIVLNVSHQGLCFHSIAPVDADTDMRFSIFDQNRRIDAKGSLAWTDAIHKVAGLRFTTLPAEARELVENWIKNPEAPPQEGSAINAASAILRTTLPRNRRPGSPEAQVSAHGHPYSSALLKLKMRVRMTGFSAGLATGMAVSLLAICALLFTYSHRRQFGESLIHMGERLAAKSPAIRQDLPSSPQAQSSATLPFADNHELAQNLPQLTLKPEPATRNERPHSNDSDDEPDVVQIPIRPDKSAAPAPTATAASPPVAASRAAFPAALSTAPEVLPAAMALPSSSAPEPGTTTAASNPVAFLPSNIAHAGKPAYGDQSASEMFLDLGKFKDELLARSIGDKLIRSGLPASVMQKGHLWMNSYHVLVGPFADIDAATRARRTLASLGYEPKPFERGSRSFFFTSRVTLNGTPLPQGQVTVSWESVVRDARVKFTQGNDVLATVQGHWMPSPRKYGQDEFVYRKTSDNSKPLLELHFYGSDRILVFRDAS